MPTDKRTIDAYNKAAETWATRQKTGNIFHEFLEKPAIYGLLPDITGKSVLCAGCGSGEEVDHLRSLGAIRTVGIDISQNLIEIAKSQFPDGEFEVMDIERPDFPDGAFDLVFSSLTMHYLPSWKTILAAVSRLLTPDGIFLFSITHPFFSATEKTEDDRTKRRLLGYTSDKQNGTADIAGDYLNAYALDAFVGPGLTVTNYHRPLAELVHEITDAGFVIDRIAEPKALDDAKTDHRMFWEIHQRIPEFMVLRLKKS
jgi:SAM-dependent methyltransferase